MKKLGKQLPRHDHRTLKLQNYLTRLQPPPLAVRYYMNNKNPWKLFRNDEIGDCTCAAAAHAQELWCTSAKRCYNITDSMVVEDYTRITGYDPITGENDNGAVELDVLNYWRQTGIAGNQIHSFVSANTKNITEIKNVISLFGVCYCGFALPLSCENQEIWSVPSFSSIRGNATPGSWGGHAVTAVGYDSRFVYIVTWGELKKMTWGFFIKYADEAWAVLSPQWLDDTGRSINGLDLPTLESDLQLIV